MSTKLKSDLQASIDMLDGDPHEEADVEPNMDNYNGPRGREADDELRHNMDRWQRELKR